MISDDIHDTPPHYFQDIAILLFSILLYSTSIFHRHLYFAANLGGTYGVCFGASILTFLEFLEFFILGLTRFLCKRATKENNVIHVKAFNN